MVARCSLLVLVCIAVGNSWALEQPATSFMVMHPDMVWIRSFHGRVNNASWYQCDTCMGAFGAKTVKPTKIYGNRRLVLALGRSQAGVRGDSNTVARDNDTGAHNSTASEGVAAAVPGGRHHLAGVLRGGGRAGTGSAGGPMGGIPPTQAGPRASRTRAR